MNPRLGRLVEGAQSAEEAYDGLSATYDDAYLSPKDLAENAWLARYLATQGYCDGRVLDVGCGTGLLLDLCAIQPTMYTGLDVSDRMLEIARLKHPEFRGNFARASMDAMTSLVGAERWQNVLYLFGTFSYATEPEKAVSELARVLMPGGRFFAMLLSHRYPDRASYSVMNAGYSVPIVTYDAKQAEQAFLTSPYLEVGRVRGLSVAVDRMQWLGNRLTKSYYSIEAATLGRWLPSESAYVVVEGYRL